MGMPHEVVIKRRQGARVHQSVEVAASTQASDLVMPLPSHPICVWGKLLCSILLLFYSLGLLNVDQQLQVAEVVVLWLPLEAVLAGWQQREPSAQQAISRTCVAGLHAARLLLSRSTCDLHLTAMWTVVLFVDRGSLLSNGTSAAVVTTGRLESALSLQTYCPVVCWSKTASAGWTRS